jgi:hypothetical protein
LVAGVAMVNSGISVPLAIFMSIAEFDLRGHVGHQRPRCRSLAFSATWWKGRSSQSSWSHLSDSSTALHAQPVDRTARAPPRKCACSRSGSQSRWTSLLLLPPSRRGEVTAPDVVE